jgi:hypothetical protein
MRAQQDDEKVAEDEAEIKSSHKSLKRAAKYKRRREKRLAAQRVVNVVSLESLAATKPQVSEDAQSFLRRHFWGRRLERAPLDVMAKQQYRRGPARQFVVLNSPWAPSSLLPQPTGPNDD